MDQQRFLALCERCRTDGADLDAPAVFDVVNGYYSEPSRRYHTPSHIEHCLSQFDLAAHLMTDADAVEMALWFHDVVYEASAGDNERRSADLFVEMLGPSVSPEFRDQVCALIMATTHRESPQTPDQGYMVDIDLSSFGLPWERFVRDSIDVREEFADTPDEEFFPGQKRFLESLLERPSFCFTKFFRDRHEGTARENITRYLRNLENDGLA